MAKRKIQVKKIRTQEDIDNLRARKDLVEITLYGIMLYTGLTHHNMRIECRFLVRDNRNPDEIIEYYIRRDRLFPE